MLTNKTNKQTGKGHTESPKTKQNKPGNSLILTNVKAAPDFHLLCISAFFF